METPPRERSSTEKTEMRNERLSLDAQSIWHKEEDIITERFAS